MKKKWLILTTASVGALGLLLLIAFIGQGSLFYQVLPGKFQLNAKVFPASDRSRSLYLAVNPNFRAEFGAKDEPTSAWLRFEVTKENNQETNNSEVQPNLWESLTNLPQQFREYYPGIEWQLFSLGISEEQITTANNLPAANSLQLAKEILGDKFASPTADINQVLSQKNNITTHTQVRHENAYDVVENLAVGKNTDLNYHLLPGVGIESEIVIGDRSNFDTTCLQLLSLSGQADDCQLPYNRFSFLLQTDNGVNLQHSPLSIDGGDNGTYYFTKNSQQYLFRLANWQATDAMGAKSQQIKFNIRQGEINGEATPNLYIVTLTLDLNWLLDKQRVYPVKLRGGMLNSDEALFLQS